MRAWRNPEDAPASEAGGLTPMGVRLPPPVLRLRSSVWRRAPGFEPGRRGSNPLGGFAREMPVSPANRYRPERRPSMGMPYRARVNERSFLNLPGFHGGRVRRRIRRGHERLRSALEA